MPDGRQQPERNREIEQRPATPNSSKRVTLGRLERTFEVHATRRPVMKVALCRIEEIPAEGTKMVDFFGRQVLVFEDAGKPKAVLNYCMHLGGPLHREGRKLVCQWHGAEFECLQGKRLKGPASPESRLILLPTLIEDGTLTYVYGE